MAYEFRLKAGTHSVGSARYRAGDVFVSDDNLIAESNAGHEKFELVREFERPVAPVVEADASVDQSNKASDLVKGKKGKSDEPKSDAAS